MKKNKMMRIASVLLVAVLLSTCAISGTFAKYTTTATGSDTARVAKWGFTTTSLNFENLFANSYTNVASGSDEKAIIAPGTSGKTSFAFVLAEGITAPEVAYSFDVSTSSSINGTSSNSNIKWRLSTSEIAPTDWTETDTWDKLLTDISALSEPNVAANAVPDMVGETYYIHWEWSFEGDDNADNTLGNATSPAEINLTITITATQKD